MAHKARIVGEDAKSMFEGVDHFWNINKKVGWGHDNKWDDVLLIQFLLNSTGIAKLVEDGIFGKKTHQAIKKFQKEYVLCADGKVDVGGTELFIEGASKWYIYTIYELNNDYFRRKRHYFNDLRMDDKLPNELCQIFSSWKNE